MRVASFLTAVAFAAGALAGPIYSRTTQVTDVKCTDPNTTLDSHTSNVALLQICGGIAGSIQKCQGNPTTTTGESGNVRFSITPVVQGATINVSKGRWEQGIKAAFAVCGQNKPFEATFDKGASTGDIRVTYGPK
ncbi:hypothetical protein GLOTRDRAFT_111873 [Gloeophyllum trabeum ATCC 11539]|uniref:Uncharacterized protein n=1 Tax=Gloeophyllum trabeum (strain ATCC 11539 / FP-39264 / Madison 617) TaxID=670483 RepID=S7PZQ2_GLOTA|nr:uncharacterized protein GLOTRDRAFT_111873 [Gloeophyllum trabeum ATCC 11539]EPQ53146.1 hypothetical protein GLOTRDRAFT_111873 [Gloeophyllum trabeum ATCC 11539]